MSMNKENDIECRVGCGACCIVISISSPIPGMPQGKKAGERCIQLTDDNKCKLFGRPERPKVCISLRPSQEMCGPDNTHAFTYLQSLEEVTKPKSWDHADFLESVTWLAFLLIRSANRCCRFTNHITTTMLSFQLVLINRPTLDHLHTCYICVRNHLEAYNPNRHYEFEKEKTLLLNQLQGYSVCIQHVVSTSIQGCCAWWEVTLFELYWDLE